jgi:hypothetical protein
VLDHRYSVVRRDVLGVVELGEARRRETFLTFKQRLQRAGANGLLRNGDPFIP